jgi:hypothetical protein
MASQEVMRKILEGNARVRRIIPTMERFGKEYAGEGNNTIGGLATRAGGALARTIDDVVGSVRAVNREPTTQVPAKSASASETLAPGEEIVKPTPGRAKPSNKRAAPAKTNAAPTPTDSVTPIATEVPEAAAPTTGEFKMLTTTNPTSKYDYDLEKADFMVKALNKMGLVGPAQEIRKSYFELDTRRSGEVADNALVALQAGNIEPAIAAHNHLIGNGVTITGYRETPDGNYELEYDNGKTATASRDGIAELLVQYKDPDFRSKTMMENLKSANEQTKEVVKARGDVAKEKLKAGYDMEKTRYVHDRTDAREVMKITAKSLDDAVKSGEAKNVRVGIDGSKTYTIGNKVYHATPKSVKSADGSGESTEFDVVEVKTPGGTRPAGPAVPATNQMGFKTKIPGSK